jgi:hypothetical protein
MVIYYISGAILVCQGKAIPFVYGPLHKMAYSDHKTIQLVTVLKHIERKYTHCVNYISDYHYIHE